METNKKIKYGVYVEIDTNEWMWDTGTGRINGDEPPLLFDTQEEAQEYADKKWNTGRGLPYPESLQEYWREYEQKRAKMIAENVPPEI